jgi:hypothetical protein
MGKRDDKRLKKLSSRTTLAAEVNRLRQLGPRETGNFEHVNFVNYIDKQIKSLHSPHLLANRDTLSFERWFVPSASTCCALTVHLSGGQNLTVPIASAYPYSGRTGSNGVTAPLQLFRCGQRHRWKESTGKIVVIEIPYPSVPTSLLLDDVGHLPAGASGFPRTNRHPVLSATVFGPDLAAAKAAGAIGVVAVWKELTAAQADDQYVPFTFPYQDIPAVWVACDKGKQLLESARRGARATLTLDATLSASAMTDTVWAVVEGEISNETILVVTHTDGGNAVEENGAIGVLELVRMFASGPRPKRTLVFVFVTGHLRCSVGKQATTEWLKAHCEWWSGKNGGRRAVAGLVIEHLGALARARRDSGERVEPAVELTYATNEAMREILKNSWAKRKRGKVLIAKPGVIHLGEGEPLYKEGIPAIALASVPEYLLAATKADIVDIKLMHEQINAFAHALLKLESTPSQRLGRAERVSCIRKARAFVQFLLFITRNRALVFHLSAIVKAGIAAYRSGGVSHLSFVNTRPE